MGNGDYQICYIMKLCNPPHTCNPKKMDITGFQVALKDKVYIDICKSSMPVNHFPPFLPCKLPLSVCHGAAWHGQGWDSMEIGWGLRRTLPLTGGHRMGLCISTDSSGCDGKQGMCACASSPAQRRRLAGPLRKALRASRFGSQSTALEMSWLSIYTISLSCIFLLRNLCF